MLIISLSLACCACSCFNQMSAGKPAVDTTLETSTPAAAAPKQELCVYIEAGRHRSNMKLETVPIYMASDVIETLPYADDDDEFGPHDYGVVPSVDTGKGVWLEGFRAIGRYKALPSHLSLAGNAPAGVVPQKDTQCFGVEFETIGFGQEVKVRVFTDNGNVQDDFKTNGDVFYVASNSRIKAVVLKNNNPSKGCGYTHLKLFTAQTETKPAAVLQPDQAPVKPAVVPLPFQAASPAQQPETAAAAASK